MVTVSLCMIVKDEEEILGRCLDSIREAVDEIIIVDTGSSDQTKEKAASYTDKIFDFPWKDDFSAARNFSFSKAVMDYCMWLDADDIMKEEERKKLISWKEQAKGEEDAVMMKYASGLDEKGKAGLCYYRERLLKREKGFLWAGRVHEAISVCGNVKYLDICIEHHSQKKAYGTRNLDIYEKMMAEGESFHTRDMFYYGRELYYHGKYEKAIKSFREFLNRRDAFDENQVEACRIAAYCCYGIGREEEALDFLYQGLKYRVPGGELCCDIGKHFMDRKMWEQAAFWYSCALHAPKKDQGGGFIQEESYGYLPCVQMSVCYYHMGAGGKALKYHRMAGKFKPYGKEYLKNEQYFGNL